MTIAVLPGDTRKEITGHCQGCGHAADLHFLPARAPWPCHHCSCEGLVYQVLQAYLAEWTARRGNVRPVIPKAVRDAVIARDGMTCRYCSRRVHLRRRGPGKLHLDHVRPWSKDGSHSLDNLVVSCATCNLSKGDDASILPLPLRETV